MAREEHRHAQGAHPFQNTGRPGGVHAGEGLVQQVEPAAAGQGAGQGQPPPHAAGEGAGVGPRLLLQLDQGQPAPRLPPARPGEHVGDVLLHRPPGQQAVLLKQEGGAGGNRHHPGRPPLEARQHPQQGGLAAAGGAGQGGDPRLRQHQGEVVQHPLFPITDRNMFR